MKKIALLVLAITSSVEAYTLSISNKEVFGDNSLPIVDASGALLGSSGYVRLGYFSSLSDAAVSSYNEATAANLITNFTTFSGTGAALTEEFGYPGLTSNTFIQDFVDGAPETGWTGESVYALITNNGDTEYGVFKFNDVIGQEDSAGSGSLTVNLESDQGTILLGTNPGATSVSTVDYSNAFQLVGETVVVPEPTSGVLLGLAGLALTARRKR